MVLIPLTIVLCGPLHLAQGPLLSEFMANPRGSLQDEDGEDSDWIEIYNPSPSSLDLGGYFLTDDAADLKKWEFPSTVLGPHSGLVVFASGKDRKLPSGPLHTNFKLKASGEYLGLVDRDGFSVWDEYSPMFPPQTEGVSFGVRFLPNPSQELSFFTQPTPNQPNSSGEAFIAASTCSPEAPLGSEDLVVSIQVDGGTLSIQQATLFWRVMYDSESSLTLADDGLSPDVTAGDGWWTATIPNVQFAPGAMVRWRVEALDSWGLSGKGPYHLSADSAEYFGTVVKDPLLDSNIPVIQWFVEDPSAAETTSGTRCSIWRLGEFYDNVFCRKRGASTAFYNKKSFKFDFNPGDKIRMYEGLGRMEEINLNTTWSDKSYVRPFLATHSYEAVGAQSFLSEPVHLRQNGSHLGLYVFAEQVDEDFLERLGLDQNGAMYKMFDTCFSTATSQKVTRQWEGKQDLQDLIDGIAHRNGPVALEEYIFDNLDIPAVISYLVGCTLMQESDHLAHNYYLYRDSDGDEEWQMFPWDKDLTFGRRWSPSDGVLNDVMWANVDPTSHPFYGEFGRPGEGGFWNRFINACYQVPRFREMYARRLWEMMEAYLDSPSTPLEQSYFEQQLVEWEQLLRDEVAKDVQVWGQPSWGSSQSFQEALAIMSRDYFQPRRIHLFETHLQSGVLPGPRGLPNQVVLGSSDPDPSSGNKEEEWLEIRNLGLESVDMSGWRLSGDVEFLFPPGSVLPPLDDLYVSPSVKSFRSRAQSPRGGENRLVLGPFGGNLKAGEDLFLWNSVGGLEDSNSSSFALFANDFSAGETAVLSVAGAIPGSGVHVAWSATGPGPTSTAYGILELSRPIFSLPVFSASASGIGSLEVALPPTSAGLPIWLQALDMVSGDLSAGVQRTIR
ncbi:MAG: CotH kinase family protein [Planctomycetes bacterium]|nr:CotH kinase family protein [Planctomycetota bacterium]